MTNEDEMWDRLAWLRHHVGATMQETLEWLIEDRNRCSRDAEREAARNHALAAERDQLQGAAEGLVLCLDPIYDWDEIERQADGGTRHAYKELKRLLPDKAYHQPESVE